MKTIIKNAAILCAITLIAGTLLGITYSVTEQPRADQQKRQREIALSNVIDNATFDKEIEIKSAEQYNKITNIYEANRDSNVVGFAFKLVTPEGYNGNVELVVGIIDGKVTGVDIIKQSETPGLGAKSDEDEFKNQFIDKTAEPLEVVKNESENDNAINAISGATITSKAVTYAVNQAIDYYNNELLKEVQ